MLNEDFIVFRKDLGFLGASVSKIKTRYAFFAILGIYMYFLHLKFMSDETTSKVDFEWRTLERKIFLNFFKKKFFATFFIFF